MASLFSLHTELIGLIVDQLSLKDVARLRQVSSRTIEFSNTLYTTLAAIPGDSMAAKLNSLLDHDDSTAMVRTIRLMHLSFTEMTTLVTKSIFDSPSYSCMIELLIEFAHSCDYSSLTSCFSEARTASRLILSCLIMNKGWIDADEPFVRRALNLWLFAAETIGSTGLVDKLVWTLNGHEDERAWLLDEIIEQRSPRALFSFITHSRQAGTLEENVQRIINERFDHILTCGAVEIMRWFGQVWNQHFSAREAQWCHDHPGSLWLQRKGETTESKVTLPLRLV